MGRATDGAPLLGTGACLTLQTRPAPAEVDCFMLNGKFTSVHTEIHRENSAFQGRSMSSEMTRIDRLPINLRLPINVPQ